MTYNIVINRTNKTFLVHSSGRRGYPGVGLAQGGATGQTLEKKSSTNYDTQWVDVPAKIKRYARRMAIIY